MTPGKRMRCPVPTAAEISAAATTLGVAAEILGVAAETSAEVSSTRAGADRVGTSKAFAPHAPRYLPRTTYQAGCPHDQVRPCERAYARKQIVGLDLHRRRSVLVRMDRQRRALGNGADLQRSGLSVYGDGPGWEGPGGATYDWCWAADTLGEGASGAPLGVKVFSYWRVKTTNAMQLIS